MTEMKYSKEQIAFGKAEALYRAGKYAEAAEAYTDSLDDGDNETVYRNRGWAFRKSGQLEKALADFQHVPDFAIARARILLDLGRLEEAVPELELAITKYADEDKAEDEALLEDTLKRLGRPVPARKKPKPAPKSTLLPAAPVPKKKKGEGYDTYAARLIAAAGLGKHAAVVEKARVPGVLLVPSKGKPATGASRLGGAPDLPSTTTWPAHKKNPMLFVLQVRLDEVAGLLPRGTLPAKGLLSFFVCEGRAHDEYIDAVSVLFTPARACAKLAPRPAPEGLTRMVDGEETKAPFTARALALVAVRKLENPDGDALKKLPADVRARYSANVFEPCMAAFEGGTHQLLGVRDRSYAGVPRGARLLLQCMTDDAAGMPWGDNDSISIFAPKAGFPKAAFEKASITLGD